MNVSPIRCPRCWKQLPAEAAFCRRCGATMRTAQPPALPRHRSRVGPWLLLLAIVVGLILWVMSSSAKRNHHRARDRAIRQLEEVMREADRAQRDAERARRRTTAPREGDHPLRRGGTSGRWTEDGTVEVEETDGEGGEARVTRPRRDPADQIRRAALERQAESLLQMMERDLDSDQLGWAAKRLDQLEEMESDLSRAVRDKIEATRKRLEEARDRRREDRDSGY